MYCKLRYVYLVTNCNIGRRKLSRSCTDYLTYLRSDHVLVGLFIEYIRGARDDLGDGHGDGHA